MEYGITATFTHEELITILRALSDRYDETEKAKEEAVAKESIEYWSKECKLAKDVYQKILSCNKPMPW